MPQSPLKHVPGDTPSLTRLLELVWGPDNRAVEEWQEAVEAWSQAWMRSVLPVWPWVAPAETLARPPAPVATEARPRRIAPPFRAHAPGKAIDKLSVGDRASVTRRFSQADIDAFARISGDDNPAHVDAAWADASPFAGRVAHGVLTAGLVSAVLGTQLPGPGSIYMSQTLKWLAPVRPDDLLTATVTVAEIVAEKGRVVLDTVVTRDGKTVLTGQALVIPPGATRPTEMKAAQRPAPTPVEQPNGSSAPRLAAAVEAPAPKVEAPKPAPKVEAPAPTVQAPAPKVEAADEKPAPKPAARVEKPAEKSPAPKRPAARRTPAKRSASKPAAKEDK